MDDFRISTSWRTHPKRIKLIRRLGKEAAFAVTDLWGWCALTPGRTRGVLAGMSDEDIAIAADYDHDPRAWVAALVDLRLLDGGPGDRSVHNYPIRNPYVAGHDARSDAAKANALRRWHREGKHRDDPVQECPLCDAVAVPIDAPAYANHATASIGTADSRVPDAVASSGNAPYPDPDPDPYPSPDPDPTPPASESSSSSPVFGGVKTVNHLQVLFSKWGWAVCMSPNQDIKATALIDAKPISAEEIAHGYSVAVTQKREKRARVSYFLGVIANEREDAANPRARGSPNRKPDPRVGRASPTQTGSDEDGDQRIKI